MAPILCGHTMMVVVPPLTTLELSPNLILTAHVVFLLYISQALTSQVGLSAGESSAALPSMPPVRTRVPAAQASAAEEVDLTGDSPVVPAPHLRRREGDSMPQHLGIAGAEEWGNQRGRPSISRGSFCATGRRRRWAAACCTIGRGLEARRCCCEGASGAAASLQSATHLECWLPRVASASSYLAACVNKALLGATSSAAGPPQPDSSVGFVLGLQVGGCMKADGHLAAQKILPHVEWLSAGAVLLSAKAQGQPREG